ncbi:MAG TPA: ferritin-like domain-containing protein [Baekduia sp.]|nr:ferritin-like domain-containing protein [Baekduia sp.]
MEMTRGALLRGGAAAGLAAVLPAGVARAALPAPAPVGDDVGFLQFAAIAEQVSQAYYAKAGAKGPAKQKAEHVAKLAAALGADAPAPDDFDVVLPARAFATTAGTATLGVRIESLLVRALLGALASTQDGSTRLLLARLLASDAQRLAALRAAAGMPASTGLAVPLDLEAAGTELDALLKATNYPTT